jgi:hypothetical protein
MMQSVRIAAGAYEVNDRYLVHLVSDQWLIRDTHKKVAVGRSETFYRKREALAFLKEYLEIEQMVESLEFLMKRDHSRIPELRAIHNRWMRQERRIRTTKAIVEEAIKEAEEKVAG